MATSPVVPTSGSGTNGSSPINGTSPQDLNTMFLQLLIAQLQNQDPTDPVDPTTFVTQLAQFSELGEVTSIYQLMQQVVGGSSGSATTGSGAAPGSPAGSGSSGTSTPVSPPPPVGIPPSALQSASPHTPTGLPVPYLNANPSPSSPFQTPAVIPTPTLKGVF
jgi:hypothetical protein